MLKQTINILCILFLSMTLMSAVCEDDSSSKKKSCRTFATSMTDNSDETYACEFDSETYTYTCTMSSGDEFYQQYTSKSAFIDEAKTVGLIMYSEYNHPETVWDYEFDSNNSKKMISKTQHHSSGNDFLYTFTEWDSKDRPTVGTADYSELISNCSVTPVTITYDEENRKRSKSVDIDSCDSGSFTEITTYNENGDVVRIQYPEQSFDLIYTISENDQACK